MIPLREAQEFVLGDCAPGVSRSVPIDEALGCVVATPVVATEPVPPFVNSSRDGYALRTADTQAAGSAKGPVHLQVIGSIMAGSHFVRALVSLDNRGTWHVCPMVGEDSHHLRAMADANSLVVLPDGEGVGAGSPVDVLLTDPEQLSVDPVGIGVRPW